MADVDWLRLRPVELDVGGRPDLPHAALADESGHVVAPDALESHLIRPETDKGIAAAAAAMAATPASLLAQQSGDDDSGRFYERGNVRIRYEESGSGFPLLLISGGGLNGSTIAGIRRGNPFNTIEAFSGEFRCIYADLRHSAGQSTGPLEIDRPWDAYTDDHLGLMDHLGIDSFMVLGFCIAGPFIWNLIKRAPDRVVAAVPAQPVGFRPELPNAMYESQTNSWAAEVVKRRPEITAQMADQFLNRLFRNNPDFVFTVIGRRTVAARPATRLDQSPH